MSSVVFIATLLNEEKALPEFLESVRAQTRQPEAVILVDGGSKDRSCDIIHEHIARGMPIQLLISEGANRSQGRNIGIRQTDQPIVAVSDVGCRLEEDWLEKIVAPLERGEAEVVSGYYAPEAQTLVERAVAAATVQTASEVNPKTFLPSSRSVAFLREAWERAGGYPEYTSEAEDTIFDRHLKANNERFIFVPDAVVYWKQPGSLRRIFWQYYRYARADGRVGLSQPHYTKVAFIAGWKLGLVVGFVLSLMLRSPAAFFFAGLYILTDLTYYLRYLLRSHRRGWDWAASLLSPIAMGVVDFANYLGFRIGSFRRGR